MVLEPYRYLWNLKCFHCMAYVYHEGKIHLKKFQHQGLYYSLSCICLQWPLRFACFIQRLS